MGSVNPALNTQAWLLRPALPALGYEAIEVALLACDVNGLPEYEARRTIASGLVGR